MDIFEAFAAMEHLPAKSRLLIGRPLDGEMDWTSSHIDEIDLTDDLRASDIEAIEDYRSGDRHMALMIVRVEPDEYRVVAIGPESVSAIVDALTLARQELAARLGH